MFYAEVLRRGDESRLPKARRVKPRVAFEEEVEMVRPRQAEAVCNLRHALRVPEQMPLRPPDARSTYAIQSEVGEAWPREEEMAAFASAEAASVDACSAIGSQVAAVDGVAWPQATR